MQLTKQQLDEFKKLYSQRFGEDLSDEQAAAKAAKLLGLLQMIYKPLTKEEFEKFSQESEGAERSDDG